MTDAVRVGIGACRCPGTPHDEDEVFLAPRATLALGIAAHEAIGQSGEDTSFLTVNIARAFVRYGVVSWNIVTKDTTGTIVPAPIIPDAVEQRLVWDEGGEDVATKAMELYYDSVIRPLVDRSQMRSRSGPTDASTSVSQASLSSLPNSSESSSPEPSETTPPSLATSA